MSEQLKKWSQVLTNRARIRFAQQTMTAALELSKRVTEILHKPFAISVLGDSLSEGGIQTLLIGEEGFVVCTKWTEKRGFLRRELVSETILLSQVAVERAAHILKSHLFGLEDVEKLSADVDLFLALQAISENKSQLIQRLLIKDFGGSGQYNSKLALTSHGFLYGNVFGTFPKEVTLGQVQEWASQGLCIKDVENAQRKLAEQL